VLPDDLRTQYKDRLQDFLDCNQNNLYMHEHELNHTQRLIDYLNVVKTPHSEAFDMPKLHNDFKQFFTQYDLRRGKSFTETFKNLSNWYANL
jgi:hypothetical protein